MSLIRNSILVSECSEDEELPRVASSSHLPSVPCEVDVKVEITPPVASAPTAFPENTTPTSISVQNSYSVDSTNSVFASDIISKSQTPSIAQSLAPSPQARKFSEIPSDSGGFLNPIGNFNRLAPSPSPPNTSSARLFKRIEEMIDLSSPYNHYRCLSPSETSLNPSASIFMESKLQSHSVSSKHQSESGGKADSSRLLRRQFSLDKDDIAHHQQRLLNLETISSMVESAKMNNNHSAKTSFPPLLPVMNQITKANQEHSKSLAQDLEKIEENPVSPSNNSKSNSNHNNEDNLNCINNSKSKKDSNEISLNIDSLELR